MTGAQYNGDTHTHIYQCVCVVSFENETMDERNILTMYKVNNHREFSGAVTVMHIPSSQLLSYGPEIRTKNIIDNIKHLPL